MEKQQEAAQLDQLSATITETESAIDTSKANAALNQLDTTAHNNNTAAVQLTEAQQRAKLNKIKVSEADVQLIRNEFLLNENEATYQLRLANADVRQCIANLLQPSQKLLNEVQQNERAPQKV